MTRAATLKLKNFGRIDICMPTLLLGLSSLALIGCESMHHRTSLAPPPPALAMLTEEESEEQVLAFAIDPAAFNVAAIEPGTPPAIQTADNTQADPATIEPAAGNIGGMLSPPVPAARKTCMQQAAVGTDNPLSYRVGNGSLGLGFDSRDYANQFQGVDYAQATVRYSLILQRQEACKGTIAQDSLWDHIRSSFR